jgi:pimeloyl-ACP methyl ester carboxylesterase
MFAHVSRTVPSTHGVKIAVYDEPSSLSAVSRAVTVADGTTATRSNLSSLLFSHATGFHGRVFAPVAEHLAMFDRTTFDYRGYGNSPAPSDWQLDWHGFGDDALAVASATTRTHADRPLVGIGHSMGGAGLVMAALRQPELFAALILYEPIIFPPTVRAGASGSNPLAEVTRRRRRVFASFDEALANFSSKPPMNALSSDSLDAYVRHGFDQRADGVHIKCDPAFEARTYEMGAMHDTWSRLPDMRVPTWVMAGSHSANSPAAIAPQVHEQLPHSTFVEWSDLGHFGPLEDPVRFAAFIDDIARGIALP